MAFYSSMEIYKICIKLQLLKIKGETIFKEQECDERGRIKGGLSSFMEGELEDLKAFFEI